MPNHSKVLREGKAGINLHISFRHQWEETLKSTHLGQMDLASSPSTLSTIIYWDDTQPETLQVFLSKMCLGKTATTPPPILRDRKRNA